MTERKPYRLPVTNTKTPMPDVKAPRLDAELTRLTNENHRLRAALVELELLVYDSYVEGLNETYDSCITEMGDEIDKWKKSDSKECLGLIQFSGLDNLG